MHQEAIHLLLKEGKTVEETLEIGEYHYYKIVINDESISSFTVTLLTVHGDPDMFISNKNGDPNPSIDTFWKRSTWAGRYPDLLLISLTDEGLTDNTTLIGTYYVAVLGSSSSVYTINYHTTLVSKEVDGVEIYKVPILLSQDKATRGVLLNISDHQIFKIEVSNIPISEEINIVLSPING